MNNNIIKNYIKRIILFEQKSNKYNIFIDALKNSNKSNLLDNINEDEISNKLSNLKKYQFEWLINYINSDILEAEGLSEIIQIIIDFDNFKNTLENKELSSYKSVNDIRKEIEKPSKRQLKRNKRLDLQGEYEVVYEDDKIIIYFPHSEKASCEIANRMGFGGVTWCTAAEKSENYFFNYSLYEGFNIYYILSKINTNSNMDKIAIGIERNEIAYDVNATVDSSNKELYRNDLENHFGKEYWINIENILIDFNKKYEKEHPLIKYLTKKEDIAVYTKDQGTQIKLSKNKDVKIRILLSGNENLDKEVQLILTKDVNEYVRKRLALNRNLDKEVQLILTKDKDHTVRNRLAQNTNLGKEVQLILTKDEDYNVRADLSQNQNLDENIQFILANNDFLKIILATNKNLSKNIQLLLVKDENFMVRRNLATNKNIDIDIQFILIKDEDADVRKNLAHNQNIDREIQLILVKDKNADVRKRLASNVGADRETQLILTKDRNDDVRKNLAFNSKITEVQLILAKDRNDDVRKRLLSNPYYNKYKY